jgi:hypothetical protein
MEIYRSYRAKLRVRMVSYLEKVNFFFLHKLRASRHQRSDRHPNFVGILIIPRPPFIAHIIIKKKKKYIQKLGTYTESSESKQKRVGQKHISTSS